MGVVLQNDIPYKVMWAVLYVTGTSWLHILISIKLYYWYMYLHHSQQYNSAVEVCLESLYWCKRPGKPCEGVDQALCI